MQQHPQERGLTFSDHVNLGFLAACLISMTLLPFMRRRLGYRLLSPLHWAPTCILLFWLCNPLEDGAFLGVPEANAALVGQSPELDMQRGKGFLGLFAFASFLLCVHQRGARWRDLKQGFAVHSYSRGQSVFGFLPLSLRVIHTVLEPLIVIALGYGALRTFSPALGWWLVFSGLSLRIVESSVTKRNIDQMINAVDGMLDSGRISEDVTRFERPEAPAETAQPTVIKTMPSEPCPSMWQGFRRRKR